MHLRNTHTQQPDNTLKKTEASRSKTSAGFHPPLVPENSVSYLLQQLRSPNFNWTTSYQHSPPPPTDDPPPPLMFPLPTGSRFPRLASSRALVPCRHNLTQVCQQQTYPCPFGRGGVGRRGEERRREERRGKERRGEVNRRGERRGEEGKREYRRGGEGRQLKH